MFKLSFKLRSRHIKHGGKTFSKLSKETYTPAERQVRQAVKSASSLYLADLMSYAANSGAGTGSTVSIEDEDQTKSDQGSTDPESLSDGKVLRDKSFRPGTRSVDTPYETVWDLYETNIDLGEDEVSAFLNLESTTSLKIANTFRRVYSHADFNFSSKVKLYNDTKEKLLRKYYKDDHVELSAKELQNYNAELNRYSFDYWKSWVTVRIASDKQFANSTWDGSRQEWTRTIKSRCIYTQSSLTDSFVESISKDIASKDKLQKITLEDLSKVHIIADPSKKGGLRMVPKGRLQEITNEYRDPLGNIIDKDYDID